jgi:serine/threonine-protein kinase
MAHDGAFTGDDLGLSAERVGDVSLLHAAPGVHVVHALVAAARGDEHTRGEATDAFVAASRRRTARRDLTHGRAGLLLGCAAIAESYAPAPAARGVRTAGDALERALRRSLAREARVGARDGTMDLGMAHGWSGVLFSLLRWSEATQRPPSARLVRRLGDLAACAEPFGRGVRWRWLVPTVPEGPPEPYVAGWCNGAAGLVQLWCLASRVVPGRRYRDLAVGSAWHAWESEVEAGPFVCCGLAGRAFALAAVARLTGDAAWWRRARYLAAEAGRRAREHLVPTGEDRPDSLYFGALGVAVLLAELAQPGPGGMPLLGPYV